MKGARRQSGKRTTTQNDIAPATEQQNQTPQMSLEEIIARCEVIDNEAARKIAQAAQRLMRANQTQIRNLCPLWGVDRKDEEKNERLVPVLKAELQAKLAKHASELDVASEPSPSFCSAAAIETTLQNLQEIRSRRTLLARVIDHACYSEDSISQAVVKMLQRAEIQVAADLAGDQQTDACGFIAADAVQRLRQWALAEANSWWSTILPDYSTEQCISRGQRALQCAERVLESDQVNRLVREYCHIANKPQVAEEWWAGAVGLDHFLEGIIHTASEILSPSGSAQHRWRVWVVNTQSSRQVGSHWFTVAIGVHQEQKEEKPQAASSSGERREPISATASKRRKKSSNKAWEPHHSMLPDSSRSKKKSKKELRPGQEEGQEERRLLEELASADAEDSACDALLAEAHEWARTNAHKPDVAKWIVALREWEQLEDKCTERQYRSFCDKHDIRRKKEAEESASREGNGRAFRRALRKNLIERATGWMKTQADQKTNPTLHAYFGKAATGRITWPEQEVPAVATNLASAYLRLRLQWEHHQSDRDFQNILWASNVGRNSVLPRKTIRTILKEMGHVMQLGNMAPKLPKHLGIQAGGKSLTIHPSNQWTIYQVQLAIMREARRWLGESERLDAISEAPETPKTIGLLASSLQKKKSAQFLPFGRDFEDCDAYNCTQCRLLFFAEMHACNEDTYGTFAQPHGNLPYTYRELQECIMQHRQTYCNGKPMASADEVTSTLCSFASNAVVTHYLIEFALPPGQRADAYQRECTDEACEEVGKQSRRLLPVDRERYTVKLSHQAAKGMANRFCKFVRTHNLSQQLGDMPAGQILALVILHSRLTWQKGKPVRLHEHDYLWIPKAPYVPSGKIESPHVPHFVKQIEKSATQRILPEMQAPVQCCLCGKKFVDMQALWKHCDCEHHSWPEARKRVLWEAEKLHALPALPTDKRRLLQNFTQRLTYSQPAGKSLGRNKVCMRQRVACGVCALVTWIENAFPCFLFQEWTEVAPAPETTEEETEDCDSEANDSEDDGSDAEAAHAAQKNKKLLKDANGYYVIDAHRINKLLDVQKYIEAWPLIPREELYASSVQHPNYPEMRWLLNTRRVPVVATQHDTCEPGLPRCAGVGNKEEAVWLCKGCMKALCTAEPIMPYFALANWNWGGRLHPLYYNLSIATKMLLGLATVICRLVVLRYSEHEEDQEKGFVGNTILLTQPRAQEIIQKLPPTDDQVLQQISVCFNSTKMTKADVGKQKALMVDVQEYIKCAELRKKICPVFAEVEIDKQRAQAQLPKAGVPCSVLEGAQGMDTLDTFTPNMDGPASMKCAACKLDTEQRGEALIEEDDETDTEIAQGAERQLADTTAPLDLPAEFLIGVREEEAQDPIDLMVVFQKNIELVHEASQRIQQLEKQRQESKGTADAGAAAAQLSAEKTKHGEALVDLRRLAMKMGDDYQQKMVEALASAHASAHTAPTGKTLHIKSGKPVNIFDPPAWAAAFTEFFYGDCAPNLARPVPTSLRKQFHYLTMREELEYSLDTDRDDPLIAGGGYRAPTQSRWNTPEFVAIFADVVRKVRILTTTKHMWEGNSGKWRGDIKTICNATVSQFESLSSIMCKHGKESMADMMRLAAEHKLLPLFKALQYMTFQTANIPLTQGYKMSLRHLGFAMNIYDGPLSIFLTTNFADLYSPITVTLMNGAGEPLGKREVNLLDDAPDMPTLQAMHRALAKYPMLQVELFLLMDRLVHTELLCMNAFLGEHRYNGDCLVPPQEDDFASTLQIGIAEFPRSALKPLEAQGRGFAHGHEKIISVPRMRAAKLKQLFMEKGTAEQPADDLDTWCMKAREAVLQAASTLQYDSAVYAGSQLGVQLRPEPFSDRQQRQSKLDGQVEEADDDKPARAKMETTLEELNGHLKKEAEACVAHGRPTLHSFKQLPLTGAIQSMMPNFRRSDSFGRIHEPDEYGYYQGHRERKQPPHVGLQNCYEEYEMTMDGEITNFCMPDGSVATAADVAADRQAWETSFARDQRANFIQNHDHDCTETCVKYRKKKQSGTDVPQRAGRKLTGPGVPQCRFRFFRHVPLKIEGIIKYVIRRGKELVGAARIACGNDENEYGKALPPRHHPFRSSSSDLLQSGLRCNCDIQYQKRAVPDLDNSETAEYHYQMKTEGRFQEACKIGATQDDSQERSEVVLPLKSQEEATQQGAPRDYTAKLLYGCGMHKYNAQQIRILTIVATAMRASNVADHYMTKYLSKAQEALGPVIQPFIAGMRRIAAAENDAGSEELTLTAKARARVRRFIFSANRTMWFSACELGIFLATGGSCVHTEKVCKVFSGKGMAMMHECKRTINHSTAAEGLLMAHSKQSKNTSMDAFLVPMDTEPEATQRRKRKRRPDEEESAAGEDDADNKEQEEPETENSDAESEREGTEESEDDQVLPAAVTGREAAGSVASIKETKQMFHKSLSHRDDWLHRGMRLQDMDYYHYARHIERVELPRTGNAHKFQRTHGSYFLFEAHYPLAKNFVQVLRRTPKMVQNVGPMCRRSDVNGGEDNALYKAYFFSCAHCEGPDQCASPLMYRHLLYPQVDDVDRYLAHVKANPTRKRIQARFEPAWKMRRWELEMLADRGYAKQQAGKRIGVIHDTTSLREIKIPRAEADAQRTDEQCFELRMQQILIQQLVRAQHCKNRNSGGCIERVMERIMELAHVPCPWHAEQPHLAEWQAVSTREILMNLDSCVDARNLAQKQAAKHKSRLAAEAEDEWGDNGKAKIVIEDLGGSPADLDEEELPAEAPRTKYELPLVRSSIERILSRKKERVRCVVGRPKEMHKEMQKVAAIFGTELDAIMTPFRVASRQNKRIGPNLSEALQQQADTAESNRLHQEGDAQEEVRPAAEMEAEARVLSAEAEALLRNIPEGTAEKGPIAFAFELAKAATLNADQLAPVALIAHDMQKAWEAQGKPARMKPMDRLIRMLILGGGGCGKSRIINLVLTPLFVQYWGPRGCVKAAPSNKAARGILGKTLHAAANLPPGRH